MIRFSIAALLLFVVFVALGCAALSYSTPIAELATGVTTVVAMIAASIAAFHAHGRGRVFASSVAIAIWCLALGWDMFTYSAMSDYGDPFYALHSAIYGECFEDNNGAFFAVGSNQPVPHLWGFCSIAQNLTVLTIAFCGGLFACYLHSRAAKQAASASDADASEHEARSP